MNFQKNARLAVHSRADLVRRVLEQNQPVGLVASAFERLITYAGKR